MHPGSLDGLQGSPGQRRLLRRLRLLILYLVRVHHLHRRSIQLQLERSVMYSTTVKRTKSQRDCCARHFRGAGQQGSNHQAVIWMREQSPSPLCCDQTVERTTEIMHLMLYRPAVMQDYISRK